MPLRPRDGRLGLSPALSMTRQGRPIPTPRSSSVRPWRSADRTQIGIDLYGMAFPWRPEVLRRAARRIEGAPQRSHPSEPCGSF